MIKHFHITKEKFQPKTEFAKCVFLYIFCLICQRFCLEKKIRGRNIMTSARFLTMFFMFWDPQNQCLLETKNLFSKISGPPITWGGGARKFLLHLFQIFRGIKWSGWWLCVCVFFSFVWLCVEWFWMEFDCLTHNHSTHNHSTHIN